VHFLHITARDGVWLRFTIVLLLSVVVVVVVDAIVLLCSVLQ